MSLFLLLLVPGCGGPPSGNGRAAEAASNLRADACYSVQDLGPVNFVGYVGWQMLGINESGTIVGTTTGLRGFVYKKGSSSQVGTLGGDVSDLREVNSRGLAVGGSTNAAGYYRAASFYEGAVTDLGTLDGTHSFAVDVNEAGVAVGNALLSGFYHATSFYKGTVTDLGSLGGVQSFANSVNDPGDIVGVVVLEDGTEKDFLLRRGKVLHLGTIGGVPGSSRADKINNAGTVCGSASAPDGKYHGFLYREGTITDLGDFGYGFSACQDVSETGMAVGMADWSAFLWNSDEGLIDLNTRIPNDSSRVYLLWASSINAAGQITSYGCTLPNCSEAEGYVLSPLTCPK